MQTIDAADVPKSLQLCSATGRVGRAVDLDDQNGYGLFNPGQVYYATGDKNEARKINGRLRKINPTLAANLDNIFPGKAVLDNATRKVEQNIPRVRVSRIPF